MIQCKAFPASSNSALHRVQSPAKDRCHPRQVVCSQREGRLSFHFGQSDKSGLAKAPDCLPPTKDFFDPFAQAQADPVTRVPSSPPIENLLPIRFLCR